MARKYMQLPSEESVAHKVEDTTLEEVDHEKQAEIPESNAYNQIILIGFICFACPGMFNVLNGMGGGGQVDQTVASNANAALYTCFALFSFYFSSALNNFLGPRLCLLIGGSTYALYAASLLNYNINSSDTLVVLAGGLLGLGAAMLWTSQGSILLSYPTEEVKGEYIATFWIIFNLGGVLGGLIPFIANYNSDSGSVNNATYIAFIVLMLAGSIVALFLKPTSAIIKSDGTKVQFPKHNSVKAEIHNFWKAILDKRIIVLIPAFFTSNFFYGYQFNAVNGMLFNLRTRGLNNCLYWGAQMLGAYLFGTFVLDKHSWSFRKRGTVGLVVVAFVSTLSWALGLILQSSFSRNDSNHEIDYLSGKAAFPIIVYLLYGLLDAIYQNYIYWLLGTMSNDSGDLARFVGVYKGFQSAGGAISWRMDAVGTSYLVQLIINWSLMTFSLPFIYYLVRNISK
ncbi:hypothetical protein HK103_000607 [Boothiomyces macroporosus]|uniref:Uncharacterized protein n=1 Tax=Boothiomyces macroporosus TaxID=261099 RepID=A0AAD5UKC6_9FUNG|nr:hypothetical protein HK103_000607 [Boothiomyces macroporosus]